MSFEKRKKVTNIVILDFMHVVSYKYIREFIKKHPDSSVSLRSWYRKLSSLSFNAGSSGLSLIFRP